LIGHSSGSEELKLNEALTVRGYSLMKIVWLPTILGARLLQFFNRIPMIYESFVSPPKHVALSLKKCFSVKFLKLGILNSNSSSLSSEINLGG
jgi:hypothetical protein